MFNDSDHNMKMEIFIAMIAMTSFVIGIVLGRGY